MKKIKSGLLALAIGSLSGCGLGFFLSPTVTFEESPQVPPPDYSKMSSWAAYPGLKNNSSLTPKGVSVTSQPKADVFFVHPTAWMSRKQWNADFRPGPAREIVDEISMGSQASAFNGDFRIFAPRYRQATLGAFYAEQAPAQRSFGLAYKDVERAFKAFLKENRERPFVLAGHSQGSLHLMRLIQSHIANTPLQKRFVAAYLPGFGLPTDWYKNPDMKNAGISPCNTPTQTHCVSAWDTYREGAEVQGQEPVYYWRNKTLKHLPPEQARQCTNPISWSNHSKATPKSKHKGPVAMDNTGKPFAFSELIFSEAPLGVKITGLKSFEKVRVSARCEGSALRVPDLAALKYPAMETQAGNYHLLDYELFWNDIRINAKSRLNIWTMQSMLKG